MVEAELLIIPKIYPITNHKITTNGLLVDITINTTCTSQETKTTISPLNRTNQAINLSGRLFENCNTYLEAGQAFQNIQCMNKTNKQPTIDPNGMAVSTVLGKHWR